MRLTTIWTMPAMDLSERLRRTAEWAAMTTAEHLPRRVRYWTFVGVGARAIGDGVVPEQLFVDVLRRAEADLR